MAQVLKDEVRDRILATALACLAEQGWARTTMASVAEKAGLSVGNLYRYFDGKGALLEAAVPPEEVAALEDHIAGKLRYLAAAGIMIDSGGRPLAELQAQMASALWRARELLAFLIEGAEGSARAGFADKLANALAAAYADWRSSIGGGPLPDAADIVLRLYRGMIRIAGGLLGSSPDEAAFARAFGDLMEYHSRGMEALALKWKASAALAPEGAMPGGTKESSI